MLLYLSGHTRTDIANKYFFRKVYVLSKTLTWNSIEAHWSLPESNTWSRLNIFNLNSDVCKLDCYPGADFDGMYEHELPTDPECVKSRTGFVINFANFPVYWDSKLQTETALLTKESGINALDNSCRELSPIIDITKSLGQAVGLTIVDTTMNVSIHKDNSWVLILSNNFPTQFTPCSKYYASNTIYFREEINKREIKLLKIETVEQLHHISTKGLLRGSF